MVAHSVRYVVRLGKRRDGDEWHPEPKLIEAGALVREGVCGGKAGAKSFFDIQADGAVCSATRLLAGRRIRKVGAQPRHDSIGRTLAALAGPRRTPMIVRASVLVIGKEDDGILPVRAIAHGVDHLRNEGLAALDIGRRVLVILCGSSKKTEAGIDK